MLVFRLSSRKTGYLQYHVWASLWDLQNKRHRPSCLEHFSDISKNDRKRPHVLSLVLSFYNITNPFIMSGNPLWGPNKTTRKSSHVSLGSPKININLYVWSISLKSQQNDLQAYSCFVFGPLFPQFPWALLDVRNSLWDLTKGDPDVLGSSARPLIPQCGYSLQTLRYPQYAWKFSLGSQQNHDKQILCSGLGSQVL